MSNSKLAKDMQSGEVLLDSIMGFEGTVSSTSPPDYLSPLFKPHNLETVVSDLSLLIGASGIEFDSIAFSGVSGAIPASVLSLRLNKNLILVRSHRENRHQNLVTEVGMPKYIIVDDLIDRGRTVERIIQIIQTKLFRASCQGIFLYSRINRFKLPDYSGIPVFKCY